MADYLYIHGSNNVDITDPRDDESYTTLTSTNHKTVVTLPDDKNFTTKYGAALTKVEKYYFESPVAGKDSHLTYELADESIISIKVGEIKAIPKGIEPFVDTDAILRKV